MRTLVFWYNNKCNATTIKRRDTMTKEKLNKEVETEEYKEFKRAMAKLNKTMTKDNPSEVAIAPLGSMEAVEVETVSTGSVVLDNLSGGGFPVGRIVELFGPESSGKTSIALNAIAYVQKKGGHALFIDAEQALDPKYAKVLGVDVEKLGLTQLIIAEQVMFTIQEMIKSGTVDLIVVDSVASLVPQAEYDEPEKTTMALLARILSKHLKIIAKLANDHRCTVILLNQIREKVGVMYGNPEDTPGGRALKFYASQRIKISRVGQVKEGSHIIGTEVQFRIVKNKIAPPFQVGKTILTFAKGINRQAEIIEVGTDVGAIEKVGNTQWLPTPDADKFAEMYTVENGRVKLGTSKKACIDALLADEALFQAAAQRMEDVIKEKRENGSTDLGEGIGADKEVADTPEGEEENVFEV